MLRTLVTFEQDGHSIDYTPPYLTRDVYTVMVDIMGRDWSGMEDAQAIALAYWCAEFCDGETPSTLMEEHADVLYPLAVEMVRVAGFTPERRAQIAQALNVWSGGDEYDPAKDDASCTCVKCMGVGDDDSLCKMKGVDLPAIQPILDWTHLASNPQLLDAPFTLYLVAKAQASAQANGAAASRQSRERDREEKKAAKAVRDKYGHNW